MHDPVPAAASGPLPTLADIERLQTAMSKLPQIEGLRTRHYFADGMYIRELWRPAGCTIVGKTHRREHAYIVATGRVMVVGDGMQAEHEGVTVIVSKPGTKRAVYAITDATCITVHRVDDILSELPADASEERKLNTIEAAIIIAEPAALFDARNELKAPAIETEPQELLP